MRQVLRVLPVLAVSLLCAYGAFSAEMDIKSGSEQVRKAEVALQSGQVEEGLVSLQREAKKGDLRALLRIAEVFDNGDLVDKDRHKACKIYSIAADHYANVDRFDPGATLVAAAFRRTAKCYSEGLGEPGWQKNMRAVAELYFHAGVTLRDPKSAFELARLYLSGEGIPQNTALAVEMLQNAARRRYAPAQALLGSMMWEGRVMKRSQAQGLALLILGRERASADDRPWISVLYDEAIIAAPKEIEKEAKVLVKKWKDAFGENEPQKDTVKNTAVAELSVPTPPKSPSRELEGLDFDFVSGTYANQTTRANVPLPSTEASAD